MVDYVTKPYMLDTLVDVIPQTRHQAVSPSSHPTNGHDRNHHTDPDRCDCSVTGDWEAMHQHFAPHPALLQSSYRHWPKQARNLGNLERAIDSRDFAKLRSEAQPQGSGAESAPHPRWPSRPPNCRTSRLCRPHGIQPSPRPDTKSPSLPGPPESTTPTT